MKASNIKAGSNIKAAAKKRKITKHEIRRRFKENPKKTLRFLKEHEDKLPEKLRGKLHKFLQSHEQPLSAADATAVDEALAAVPDDEVIVETEQESSEEAADAGNANVEEAG